MKSRRHGSRARTGLVLGVLATLASDVAASESSTRFDPRIAAPRSPSLAKTRGHGGKRRPGEEAAGPAITYTGFHVFDDGSSRIFVKLSSEVPVEARYSGKRLEYVFRGARIPLRNNKNPLITEHFGAAVVSARFVQDSKGKGPKKKTPDARFEIILREESKPPHKIERMPDGTAIFTVDIPKPSTPPPPAPDPVPPRGKGKSGE